MSGLGKSNSFDVSGIQYENFAVMGTTFAQNTPSPVMSPAPVSPAGPKF